MSAKILRVEALGLVILGSAATAWAVYTHMRARVVEAELGPRRPVSPTPAPPPPPPAAPPGMLV